MHKARENANKSFSIGKTWNLEELTGLDSFTHLKPQTPDDAQRKEWAGDCGFIVIMAKPYYWKAGTAKEKEFFIASVVKIFRKYTGGRVPDLSGFSQQQMDSMIGPTPQQPNTLTPPGPPRPNQRPSGVSSPGRPPPLSRPPPTPEGAPPLQPRSRPPTAGEDRSMQPSPRGPPPPLPPFVQNRDPARGPRPMPSQDSGLRQPPPSRGQMRPAPSPGFDGQRLTPQSSRSDIPNKSMTSDASSISSREGNPPPMNPMRSPEIPRSRPSETSLATSDGGSVRPPSAPYNSSIAGRDADQVDDRFRQAPPERRRPPIAGPIGAGSNYSSPSLNESTERLANPSTSPGRPNARRPSAAAKSQESQESQPEKLPGAFPQESPKPRGNSPAELERFATPVGNSSTPPPAQQKAAPSPEVEERKEDSTPTPQPTPPTEDSEEFRPGLGPMVKKASNKDVASTFRKAANKYNAFKPRAGGAAERFKASQKETFGEPDGVTGVVPAPGKPVSSPNLASGDDSPIPETPDVYERQEPPKPVVSTNNIPEVTVSSPQSAAPKNGKGGPADATAKGDVPLSTEAKKPEKRRQRRRSLAQAQYLSKLGVDPSVLEGRGLDFEIALSDFGWGNSASQSKKLEAIEADVRRELGRVEAGSWLGHLEQKDDRVEAVEKLLDKAIAECEELEGLLTLYNVELSVRRFHLGILPQRMLTRTHRASTMILPSLRPRVKVFKSKLQIRNYCKMNCRLWWTLSQSQLLSLRLSSKHQLANLAVWMLSKTHLSSCSRR